MFCPKAELLLFRVFWVVCVFPKGFAAVEPVGSGAFTVLMLPNAEVLAVLVFPNGEVMAAEPNADPPIAVPPKADVAPMAEPSNAEFVLLLFPPNAELVFAPKVEFPKADVLLAVAVVVLFAPNALILDPNALLVLQLVQELCSAPTFGWFWTFSERFLAKKTKIFVKLWKIIEGL